MPDAPDTPYLGSGQARRIRELRLAEPELTALEIAQRLGVDPKHARRVLKSPEPREQPPPSGIRGVPSNTVTDLCCGCHYWHRHQGRDTGRCESDLLARVLRKLEPTTPYNFGCVMWRSREPTPVQEPARHAKQTRTDHDMIADRAAWHAGWGREGANG